MTSCCLWLIHPATATRKNRHGVQVIRPGIVAAGGQPCHKLQERWCGRSLEAQGTVGSATLMCFGTPRQVHDEVHLRTEQLGREGGLILSPAYDLEDDVPLANVEALFAGCGHHLPGFTGFADRLKDLVSHPVGVLRPDLDRIARSIRQLVVLVQDGVGRLGIAPAELRQDGQVLQVLNPPAEALA